MPEALLEAPPETPPSAPAPRLLVELESRPQVFFANLRDALFPRELPPLAITSAPAAFWPDVFVKRELPWRRFIQSGGGHVLFIIFLLYASRFAILQPQAVPVVEHSEVIHYEAPEYLPPLDTLRAHRSEPKKADPALSAQPIISLPREADNHSQTIVTAPDVKLQHDVPLPNIVSWAEKPKIPIQPVPLVPASSITRLTPRLENSVVAPPPDATRTRHRDAPTLQTAVVAPPPDLHASDRKIMQAPEAAVIAPPPSVELAARPVGQLNIARSSVIAPAPQLAVGAQRAVSGARVSPTASATAQVVAPPPSVAGSGSSAAGSRVIALNLHPTVGAPPTPPAGNRRGSFAASPGGHAGASGEPGSATGTSATDGRPNGNSKDNGSGSNKSGSSLPAGLYVGKADPAKTGAVAGNSGTKSAANSVNPNLLASARPPRITAPPGKSLQPGNEAQLSPVEREVFGEKKFYSLTLNMPNLNSAGGSWVIRFAELKQDANSTAELAAPTASRKVDPAYPIQIMRENVAGTVILYAIIHADGTVGSVRVLRGIDDRLDLFASQALAKWQFHPATKNGAPVDVEATFQIPFKPTRTGTSF